MALEGDLPSSLLAALAVDALGPRNVVGLVLGRNRIFTPAQEEAEAARCAAVRAIAERLHIRTVERDAPDAARVLDRDVSAGDASACVLARWASCWRIRRSSWVRWR